MDRKQLIIIGGIIVLGLLLAFPLTWVFTDRGDSNQQLVRVAASEGFICQTDANGVDWAITPVGVRSTAAEPNGAQVKPAFVVKTDVLQTGGREVLIGLILQGRDGQTYHPSIIRGRVRLPAPRLRIVNEAGQVVLDDSFRYG